MQAKDKSPARKTVLPCAGRGGKAGFTLVEVMTGMVVLSVVFGGVYALLIQSQYVARATAQHAHALQVARSNIEALRKHVGYADAALSAGAHTGAIWACPQIYSIDDDVVYLQYNPSYTVTETSLGGGVSYKTVDFQVQWNGQSITGTRQHTLEMSTVISSALNR